MQPALAEKPAGQDIGRPVHAEVHTACTDGRRGQQRHQVPRRAAGASAAKAGAGGENRERGVLGRQAEPLGLGKPPVGWRARPRDDSRHAAASGRARAHSHNGQGACLPVSTPDGQQGGYGQGCRHGRWLGQAAHQPGPCDGGRRGGQRAQLRHRHTVQAHEPAARGPDSPHPPRRSAGLADRAAHPHPAHDISGRWLNTARSWYHDPALLDTVVGQDPSAIRRAAARCETRATGGVHRRAAHAAAAIIGPAAVLLAR